MPSLALCRYLALGFAVVLAVVEALLNIGRPGPDWQYAPLWIIDYVIVGTLLMGFWLTRRPGHPTGVAVLIVGWALAAGVFYMALFMSLDPEANRGPEGANPTLLGLSALALAVQALGLGLAVHAHHRSTIVQAR
jgi:hypothetical protein